MHIDIGRYYYRKAVKQDDNIVYKPVNEKEERGFIVSVSQSYLGCKDENDMKLRLIKDLRDEADKIYYEVLKDECKRLTKIKKK